MTPAARVQAAITLLDDILAGKPAEQVLTSWARASRYAGSKDRAAVRDHVFDALRCRRSYAALGGAETGRGLMLGALRASGSPTDPLFDGSAYGPDPVAPAETGRLPETPAEAGDIPDWLWPEFERSLGDGAVSGAAYLQQRAPVFLRVNTQRTTPGDLSDQLSGDGITAVVHPVARTALEVTAGARRLRNASAFQDGLFELQDVASQAVVEALPWQDGQSVLDYCAGGGGKTLAIAAQARVSLTAHDSDPRRMRDLPARARRAGVAVELVDTSDLRAGYDVVLCDAPCSGSGSWRRAPDGKWSLTPQRLAELTKTQDQILTDAAKLVGDVGILAYATCSVLISENEERVSAFLDRHPGWKLETERRWPLAGGGDGFFLAILTRK